MPKKLIVSEVVEVPQRVGWIWSIAMDDPDTGKRLGYGFPPETFEIRAAEYDLDPEDRDTLMDVILHEPYIPDPTLPANFERDAAYARGMRGEAFGNVAARFGKGNTVPPNLFNTETIGEAREALFIRLEHVKNQVVQIGPPTRGVERVADPLDQIRSSPRINPELFEERKARFQENREKIRRGLRNRPDLDSVTRKRELRGLPDPSAARREQLRAPQE